jgi:hypothetical protein
MRISTLIILSLFISSTLTAQDRGQILIGGSLGFGKSKTDNMDVITKSTNFYLAPSIGKFYRNNRLAGVNLIYNHTSFTDKNLNRNSYGAGIFLRQYQPLGKSFYLFAEEGINAYAGKYGLLYSSNPDSYVKAKEQTAYLYFFPGIAYGINKKLQLEIGLTQLINIGYNHRSYVYEYLPEPNKNSENNFYLNTVFLNPA